jgi:uncharacterized protein
MEVDVPRKRIALTRRLDDVPGEARGGKRDDARGAGRPDDRHHRPQGRDARGGQGPKPRPGQSAPPANTAMADALRALKR